MVNGYERYIHVSQVLRGEDRFFHALSTMVFRRPVITAKATIFNKDGDRIENEDMIPKKQ